MKVGEGGCKLGESWWKWIKMDKGGWKWFKVNKS